MEIKIALQNQFSFENHKWHNNKSDDIHIYYVYLWQSGNGGGFTYTRSTDPNLTGYLKKLIILYPNPTTDLFTQTKIYFANSCL